VRPGITGWAQVRYHYANNLEEEIEKLKYDLYYIKHMSPWLDFLILLETLKVVCGYSPAVARSAVVVAAPPPRPVVPARMVAARSARRVRFAGNVRHTGEA
jgi:hypothetical protein